MRFVAFEDQGRSTIGVLDGDEVIPLKAADPALPDNLVDLLHSDGTAFEYIEHAVKRAVTLQRHPLESLTFRPVSENAGKYFCLGLNYAAHADEGGFEKPESPTVFVRSASSLVAHEQPLLLPQCTEQLDYEGELALIIGRAARRVPQARALDYVAGYSCFNDASARDYQFKTTQWTLGKNFDATGGFGPMFVTADELPPGGAGLRLTTRLNGQVMQDADTADMIFGVAETVSVLSQCCTLYPGDVIVMGTPAGVGFARKPPVWLQDGDQVEVEIEGIGTLRNPVRKDERDPA
ncbi:MAG: fumarylacetoacetate hydrolase family protein [Gammaproteobacteria bacterium]|jgi:acylpyruvate hydrolase